MGNSNHKNLSGFRVDFLSPTFPSTSTTAFPVSKLFFFSSVLFCNGQWSEKVFTMEQQSIFVLCVFPFHHVIFFLPNMLFSPSSKPFAESLSLLNRSTSRLWIGVGARRSKGALEVTERVGIKARTGEFEWKPIWENSCNELILLKGQNNRSNSNVQEHKALTLVGWWRWRETPRIWIWQWEEVRGHWLVLYPPNNLPLKYQSSLNSRESCGCSRWWSTKKPYDSKELSFKPEGTYIPTLTLLVHAGRRASFLLVTL